MGLQNRCTVLEVFPSGPSSRSIKLTTDCHPVSRLRMCAAVELYFKSLNIYARHDD
jgi:hypothetical protein